MAQATTSVISRIEEQGIDKKQAGISDEEIFDELENELDDDFDLGGLRERRMEELKKEYVNCIRLQVQYSDFP